ncbi:hypothetical protein Patl1_28855 [Pistacia atlantica]|uniref:Uncharacterized protein n=1 Tax=Pistacia atlantica TaxID=434234 RepID=A0ACC1BCQ9_9ROSI|nr:hypothetical protein Patl1_28855 [Pistacia atlantica]
MRFNDDSSSDDEAALVSSNTHSVSQPRPIPRSAGYGTFLAVSLNLPMQSKGLTETIAGFNSRRVLHGSSMEHSVFGQWLGWLMAAIYMGGRLPQIWLNVKSPLKFYKFNFFLGLNPLMFLFALVANVTYVLSILVRNTEWENIKANMPWLLDAIVCVALDLFVLSVQQWISFIKLSYCSTFITDISEGNLQVNGEDQYGHKHYEDATKATIA